ncbi:MAG: SSS family solute:Na+ symporter [Myxococcota bacterium]|jgi:SSS family solute:Na+ symporter
MTHLDWAVLVGTIGFIVIYGAWKTRGVTGVEGYLRGDNSLKWPTIGLSVMATQASAITFLSTPGQAYDDGMGFVQFYFGLPLAMIVISTVIVQIYYRLKVFTAYEYLETRFDLRTRLLGAFLFLVSRGLATGITIYAPAIILASIMGWPLNATCLAIGSIVIVYTVMGGTKAVSQTQKQQMVVMLGGMVVAAIVIVTKLPKEVSLSGAAHVAGALGRMEIVDFKFDLSNRYNFWSGITGGFFLALAYFGTDQSQVQRYLSGRSVTESRFGLLFNGVLKIPMQLLILFVGILVFVFYQFVEPPVTFNRSARQAVHATEYSLQLTEIETRWSVNHAEKRGYAERYVAALDADDAPAAAAAKLQLAEAGDRTRGLRNEASAIIAKAAPRAETKDRDYIFISFVLDYLPKGLVGLLLAVILSAAMSSTASELSALGSTTTIDFYKRTFRPDASDLHYLRASKLFTAFWGVLTVAFASYASLLDNLIQAVNILGSLFYGTVLGIFLTGFFLKSVRGPAVFMAAIVAEILVIGLWKYDVVAYLWFNVIGCAAVAFLSLVITAVQPRAQEAA